MDCKNYKAEVYYEDGEPYLKLEYDTEITYGDKVKEGHITIPKIGGLYNISAFNTPQFPFFKLQILSNKDKEYYFINIPEDKIIDMTIDEIEEN